MSKIFVPRTGLTPQATAIFKGLNFPVFRGTPVPLGRPQVIKNPTFSVAIPPPGRGFPAAPPKIVSPPRGAGSLTFKPPASLGRPSKKRVTSFVEKQPLISTPGVGNIASKPIQKTSGVIQSGGSGVGRLKSSLKSTFAVALTPQGKLNIPLLALGLTAVGLLLR